MNLTAIGKREERKEEFVLVTDIRYFIYIRQSGCSLGTCKNRRQKVLDYLVKMVDDPGIETPTSYSPGQAIRAAKAIYDINNWTLFEVI